MAWKPIELHKGAHRACHWRGIVKLKITKNKSRLWLCQLIYLFMWGDTPNNKKYFKLVWKSHNAFEHFDRIGKKRRLVWTWSDNHSKQPHNKRVEWRSEEKRKVKFTETASCGVYRGAREESQKKIYMSSEWVSKGIFFLNSLFFSSCEWGRLVYKIRFFWFECYCYVSHTNGIVTRDYGTRSNSCESHQICSVDK